MVLLGARLGRREWGVLGVALLFWVLDGYATYVLLLTVVPSLHELLPPALLPMLPRYAGYLIALTLFGWASGGILGGRVGDLLGRRRTMILAVLVYGLFTGLSALATSWWMLGVLRLLTGIGIGAEWGVGTSLLQESWPNAARTKGAGILQAGFSLGALFASGLFVLLSAHLGLSWRVLYGIGALPVILVALVARQIPESRRWVAAIQGEGKLTKRALGSRHLVPALLVSLSITVGWWAISSWVPTYAALLAHSVAAKAALAGLAGVLYNVGEIFGCILFGFLADRLGRRPVTASYFLGALVMTPVVFLLVKNPLVVVLLQLLNGYLSGGLYSWYAIHPPELFPTVLRATAISLIFNSSRYLAMVGAIVSSLLVQAFGGLGLAATTFALVYLLGIVAIFLLPETRGEPLPD